MIGYTDYTAAPSCCDLHRKSLKRTRGAVLSNDSLFLTSMPSRQRFWCSLPTTERHFSNDPTTHGRYALGSAQHYLICNILRRIKGHVSINLNLAQQSETRRSVVWRCYACGGDFIQPGVGRFHYLQNREQLAF